MSDEELAWETTGREVAYECPGFEVVHEDVRLPDGTETDFDYLSEPPAVVVLPFTTGGEVVVVAEWREAVDRVNRGLPAGGLEPDDDDLAAAARRELTEETGYEAGAVREVASVEPSNGVADSVHHYFVAEDCTPTGEQDLDADESIHVDTTSYEGLLDDLRAGDVRDGRTALGVLYYQFLE